MHPRSLGWHHCYLALGLSGAALCLVLLIAAPRYVLPLAVVLMAAFSSLALLNAYVERRENGDDPDAGRDRFSFGRPVDDDERF